MVSAIKTLSDHLNPAVLHEKYVTQRLSLKQVAELIGVSKGAVLESLRRFGIPVRPRYQSHGRPSNPPYGYHLVGGRLVEHPREQKLIQTVKRLYAKEGYGLNAIAKKLTQDGVPTKKGRTVWHHEMVRSILKKEDLI
jgi:hypothetical protein